MDYWKNKGIDTRGMFLKDGSGMARSNGITAEQLTKILVKITKENYYKEFYHSLPLAKKEGTMFDVGKEINDLHRLRAKTGSISRVYALTGYFRNKEKQMMAFTLIFNDFTTDYKDLKQKIETFLKVMVENS
jgi:D-alanyl-D-alanine carboxypeptidase/D-alanyl-D-alanine-endopeptidase (penicillin-binding protein 4)